MACFHIAGVRCSECAHLYEYANGPTPYCTGCAALREENARLISERCHHGWRGAIAEAISTPCPSCGMKSLFIGSGGHLTCGNLSTCKEPTLGMVLDRLTRERDDAKAEWAALREHSRSESESLRREIKLQEELVQIHGGHASRMEIEVARLEGLILDWDDAWRADPEKEAGLVSASESALIAECERIRKEGKP